MRIHLLLYPQLFCGSDSTIYEYICYIEGSHIDKLTFIHLNVNRPSSRKI